MSKKLVSFFCLFFVLLSIGFGVALAFEVTEKKEGYPYNDLDTYIYFVKNGTKSNFGKYGKIDSDTVDVGITVRNKKNVILSTDTITVNFDNLPLKKIIGATGTQMSASASARFDFRVHIPLAKEKKTPNEIWQEIIQQNKNSSSTVFYDRPALISTSQGTKEIDGKDYIDSKNTQILVYFNDITLPNAIATLTVSYSSNMSLGPLEDTTQGRKFIKEMIGSIIPAYNKIEEEVQMVNISTSKICRIRKYDEPSKNDVVVNTQAAKTKGTTSIPMVVFIILGGALTGIIGAGAAGSGSNGKNSQNKSRSSFSMVIEKDFRDSIKYNDDQVTVKARIVEHTPKGQKINRLDLTNNITVFSKSSYLEVSKTILNGESMCAGIIATDKATEKVNKEGVITFRYVGANGSFTNNVTFKIIGECYVSIEKETLLLLAFSGKEFHLKYTLENFLNEPERVEVKMIQKTEDFTIELGKNDKDETIIIAQDKTQKKLIERFFETYSCEIIAENDKEKARTVFQCSICYEGILPDFLGKKPEILAYQDAKKEMLITNIAIRKGIWNSEEQDLSFQKPGKIQINFEDEKDVFNTIGIKFEKDFENAPDSYDLYKFEAEKSLPNSYSIDGFLNISGTIHDTVEESKTKVILVPDILQDQKNWELEYQSCLHIIKTYLPTRFRSKKLVQLEADKDKLGIKDLRLYRKNCWNIASRCILQEKESYLIDSYWYDEAIATAELTVYVGDIALEIALTPFGGPITGFVVTQVKSALIDLISMRIERGALGYQEMVDMIINRLQQGAGQADGLIQTPGFDKPKALAAWLASYVLYRIMYHWYFDKDAQGKPKGLSEAIQNGVMDFAGKGISMLLGQFANNIADKRGISSGSTSKAEQKFINEKVSKATKKGLDTLDKVAEVADNTIESFINTLIEFLDRIKNGVINLY